MWARVCGHGEPALSLWRACPAGCCAPRGWREVASEGGEPLTVLRGVWCQVLSLCRSPVLGAGSQAPLPVFPGSGWCGRGDPAPAPQRALLQAGVARCWGGGRASPQGVAPLHCEARLRIGARPLLAARPRSGWSGSAVHVLWARACRRGEPALSLWRAWPAGCCAPQGRREVAPGGRNLAPL